jgi:hypothetical protein
MPKFSLPFFQPSLVPSPEKTLAGVLDQATRAGFTEMRLKAGLALADLEEAQGHAAEALVRRTALQREAKAKGYLGMASRPAA